MIIDEIKTKHLLVRKYKENDFDSFNNLLSKKDRIANFEQINKDGLIVFFNEQIEGYFEINKIEDKIYEIKSFYSINQKALKEALLGIMNYFKDKMQYLLIKLSEKEEIDFYKKNGFTYYKTDGKWQVLKCNITKNHFWMIGDVVIPNQVILAPMAGICNEAYRIICKEMGAGLVYAEMVSDKGINYKNIKTLNMLNVSEKEHPISMQIFGSDKNSILEAALQIEKTNADIIDINMGCPVNKIAKKSNAGAALLKDPNKVYEIVKNVVDHVSKPVTVKIRSGWDLNSINAVIVAKKTEEAGASAIAIHPRTRSQMYNGLANWDIIAEIKKEVRIPVIGNGDIKDVFDAKKMLDETNCDAVMLGRKALGNPWIFDEINNYLEKGLIITRPTSDDIRKMIKKHTNYLETIKSEHVAILEMRNHASWYLKGLPNATSIKGELFSCKTKADLFTLIDKYFDSMEG